VPPRFDQADQVRPDQRTAVAGGKPDADMRIADLCVFDDDGDIACQRNACAQPHGVSVDPRDHRLGALEHADDDRAGFGHADLPAGTVGPVLDHAIKVAAGAECAVAAARHHDDSDVGV